MRTIFKLHGTLYMLYDYIVHVHTLYALYGSSRVIRHDICTLLHVTCGSLEDACPRA